MPLCITQVRLSVFSASITWYLALLSAYKGMFTEHAIISLCLKVRGPHGLFVLLLVAVSLSSV